MEKIAVIGGGSWATALVKILSENKSEIHWWMRQKDDVQHLLNFQHNPRYLSGVRFDLNYVKPSTDLSAVIKASDWVILAVPGAFVQIAIAAMPPDAFENKIMVSAIKGMIPKENVLITDYLEKHYKVPSSHQCVIAGPCHAEEVAMEKQSYLTIGSHDLKNATRFCELLRNRYVKANPLRRY